MAAAYASVDEITELLGIADAVRLFEKFGGVVIYVPRAAHIKAEHPVAQVIGVEGLRKLSQIYQQEHVKLPRGVEQLRRRRDAEIRASGLSIRQAALRYHLTSRQIEYIRAQRGDDARDEQTSLF